jgi:hypothetical protein
MFCHPSVESGGTVISLILYHRLANLNRDLAAAVIGVNVNFYAPNRAEVRLHHGLNGSRQRGSYDSLDATR